MLVATLLLLVTLSQLGVDLYLPALPWMIQDLHTTNESVKLTLTFFLIGYGASQLLYGPLSDRYGRKNTLVAGISLFLVATLGCIFAPTITVLTFCRFIEGAGIGCGPVLIRAIIRDSYQGKDIHKLFSYTGIAWSLTPITAPLLGSYIFTYFGWRANFVSLFIYTIFIFLLVLYWVTETNKNKQKELSVKSALRNYLRLLKDKQFIIAAVCSALAYAILISYCAFSSFLYQNYFHLSTVEYGRMTLLVALAYLIGTSINSRLLNLFTADKITFTGVTILTGLVSCMLFLGYLEQLQLEGTILLSFLIFFAVGIIYPNCTAKALIPFPEYAGTAGALLGFIQMFACGLASFVIARIQISALSYACVTFIITILIIICYGFLYFEKGAIPSSSISYES